MSIRLSSALAVLTLCFATSALAQSAMPAPAPPIIGAKSYLVIDAQTGQELASLDPDTVDIYVTAPGTDISDESVAPTLADVPYLANTGYLALPGGTYDITVTVSGMRTPAIGPLTDVAVQDGGIYTIIARDALPGDAATDLGVILIDDTPAAP